MLTTRKQFLKHAGLLLGSTVLFKPYNLANYQTQRNLSTCPGNLCNYDLTSDSPPFSTVSKTTTAIGYGKGNSNHKDVYYVNEHHGGSGCTHSSTDCDADGDNALLYHVYYPPKGTGNNQYDYETCAPLPALIYAHEGGFSDCSDYSGSGTDSICTEFAKRGFVTFNVEYRRGIKEDNINSFGGGTPNTSVQQELAVYRASQDVRGAIRSIIKRQNKQGDPWNDEYQIDTDLIFLAGTSAGAATMLTIGYLPDQSFMNSISLKSSGSTYTIQDVLGPIEADYYYGGTGVEYLSKIKGIFSMWGGISVPYSVYANNSETNFFNGIAHPPVICFHGLLNPVFNYQFQDLMFPLHPELAKKILTRNPTV